MQRPNPANFSDFSHLYQALGCNTGNLLFTNAVWRQVGGQKTRLNFVFDAEKANEEYDAIIIPAANWINANVDFGHVAEPLEKLKIPVVIIGLGAQNEGYDTAIPLKDGTKRFLRAVFDRATSVSVRGEFTQNVLHRLGYRDTRVTGCPSLYCDFRQFQSPRLETFDLSRCLLHPTRYSASHAPYAREASPNRDIFRFAYSHRLDLLFQSELEELALLLGFENEPEMHNERTLMLINEIYKSSNWQELSEYLRQKGKTFLDVDAWADAMPAYQFVYGTRLHGTIMALNSGTPGMLLYHDSRTREMAEFAGIPHIDANKADISKRGIRKAYEKLNLSKYYQKRAKNIDSYISFLKENNVETPLSE